MGWCKITDKTTGETQFVAGLGGVNLDDHEVIEIVDDRPPEELEQVGVDGVLFVPLEIAQNAVWEKVKAKRTVLEEGLAPTPFGAVQCDEKSKLKINGLVSMAQISISMGQPFATEFTMADNSVISLDATTAIQMGMAVGQFIDAIYTHARNLRDQIYAADATPESVTTIDIEGGWPS